MSERAEGGRASVAPGLCQHLVQAIDSLSPRDQGGDLQKQRRSAWWRLNGCQPQLVVEQVKDTTNQQAEPRGHQLLLYTRARMLVHAAGTVTIRPTLLILQDSRAH